jgi:SAM-dependent methyltransferase
VVSDVQRASARSVLRCVHCNAPWQVGDIPSACPNCLRAIPRGDGIPILARDPVAVECAIAEARSAGREAWFVDPQEIQWTGPYRHHQQKRVDYVKDAIRRHCKAPLETRVVLDLGCGDGEHHRWLRGHAGVLYASDYNLVRLRRARARKLASFVYLADVTDYPSVDRPFDLVFCNHVLEHITDDAHALTEIRRILADDGVLILGVPNEGAAFWRLAYRLQPWTRRATDHVQFYTAETIAQRCRDAGLDVVEIHPLGWGIPHWSLDARVRGYKRVDDLFEAVGRRLFPSQATSLYIVARTT